MFLASHEGIPSCDGLAVTAIHVTSGLTSTICDKVPSSLKLEVTHGTNWLRAR